MESQASSPVQASWSALADARQDCRASPGIARPQPRGQSGRICAALPRTAPRQMPGRNAVNDCPLTVHAPAGRGSPWLSANRLSRPAPDRPAARRGPNNRVSYPGPASAYRAKSVSADAASTRCRQRPSDYRFSRPAIRPISDFSANISQLAYVLCLRDGPIRGHKRTEKPSRDFPTVHFREVLQERRTPLSR